MQDKAKGYPEVFFFSLKIQGELGNALFANDQPMMILFGSLASAAVCFLLGETRGTKPGVCKEQVVGFWSLSNLDITPFWILKSFGGQSGPLLHHSHHFLTFRSMLLLSPLNLLLQKMQ